MGVIAAKLQINEGKRAFFAVEFVENTPVPADRFHTMRVAKLMSFLVLLPAIFLAGCSGEKDFCKYLSVAEARSFDPAITSTEMRQTELILYCVYKSPTSDILFVSLDTALKHSAVDFLSVIARNSPSRHDEIRPIPGFSNESAALFQGESRDQMKLEFLLAQNRDYSVFIRAHGVTDKSTGKMNKLVDIAAKVLSRL